MVSKLEQIKKILSQEKRKQNRLSLPIEIFYAVNSNKNWSGPLDLYDISGGGIKFFSSQVIEKTALVSLKIKLPNYSKEIITTGQVIWSKNNSKQQEKNIPPYAIGIKFNKMALEDRKQFIMFISENIILKYFPQTPT